MTEERPFVCGTRRVIADKTRAGIWRVVCASCGGGGSVAHAEREEATKAAVRDSSKPCPARPSCGAR